MAVFSGERAITAMAKPPVSFAGWRRYRHAALSRYAATSAGRCGQATQLLPERCCRFHRRRRHTGTHRRDHTDARPNHANGRAHHRTPHAAAVIIPPSGTAQSSWDPASNQPTAVDPAIRPALQRIIDQTAQAAPTETMVQNPPMPNPVERVKRGEYLQRGTLPLILLAAPMAALAANAPLRGHHRGHCVVVATAHPGL